MFRKATILVVSALAALTAAQPEIQSSNGAINMETREGERQHVVDLALAGHARCPLWAGEHLYRGAAD